jgi:hypothetical protein
MVRIVLLLVFHRAFRVGKIYEIYFKKKSFYKYTVGVTMVVDVRMGMAKPTVRVHKTIVVEDVNFDIILITTSIYTIIHIMVNKSMLFIQ